MTFLAAKKTYRYGDSIAYRCVSRMLAHVPCPFAPVRPPQHAVRPPVAVRPPRAASIRYNCLTLLRETTVVWSCEIHGA